jgi:cell division protein FtsN
MILALIVLILLVALGGMWGLASYESAHAEALQAQALLTANQTVQVSVVGQTVVSLALAALVVTLLVGVLVGLVFYQRSKNQSAATGKWQSGPNARWQKTGPLAAGTQPPFELAPQAALLQQQMLQQQLLTLWLMRQLGQPSERAAQPEVLALPEPVSLELQSDLPWWE